MKKGKVMTGVITIVGILLFLSGVLLFAYSQYTQHQYTNQSQEIVDKFESLIPQKTNGYIDESAKLSMSVLEINGEDFIGTIKIPSAEYELPVCAYWQESSVKKYPCRFTGSLYDNSLVIGGYDSSKQFGIIKTLAVGQIIKITDVSGRVYSYAVKSVDTVSKASKEVLVNNQYDLSLYVRDSQTGKYIVVGCKYK